LRRFAAWLQCGGEGRSGGGAGLGACSKSRFPTGFSPWGTSAKNLRWASRRILEADQDLLSRASAARRAFLYPRRKPTRSAAQRRKNKARGVAPGW